MANKLPPMNLPGPAVPWGREVQRVAQMNDSVANRLERNAAQAVRGINFNKGLALDNNPAVTENAQTLLVPGVMSTITAVQSWAWDSFKTPTSTMNVSWAPISNSEHGVPMRVTTYEVWIRAVGDANFVRAAASENFSVVIERLTPGTDYEVRVRGVSMYGVAGEFSEVITAPAPAPLTPITAPTQPTLESGYGVVVVTWDGALADATALPIHFDYVQAVMAALPEGPWIEVGHRMPGAQSVNVANLPAGETRYFKLQPHDKFGEIGADSAVSSIVVVGTDLGDLEQNLIDLQADIDAAKLNITTALEGDIDGIRIIDRTLIGEKFIAGSITGIEIAGETITGINLAGETIEGIHIKGRSIEGDRLVGGSVGVNEIDPAIGGVINLNANDEFNVVIGRIDSNEGSLDTVNGTLEEMVTYYQFGADGAVITTPDSPFALKLSNNRIEMQENGTAVSWWENQELHVRSFVGEEVILGNHKLEKYGTGTVVRAL